MTHSTVIPLSGFDTRAAIRHRIHTMKNTAKILTFLLLCVIPTGCDEFGWNPLDPEYQSANSTNQTKIPAILLKFSVPTLNDSASFFDERTDPETGVITRRRTWRGPPGNDVSASILENRYLSGAVLGTPPQPELAVQYWDQLRQRQLDFKVLYASENAIGAVQWRRFVMGAKVCVVFSQGWSAGNSPPTRHIMGYYCAAAGHPLTDGQAETVVQSVRVQEGDPALSPDG